MTSDLKVSLPKNAFINTAEMPVIKTAFKEIYNFGYKQWIKYTDIHSYKQSIKFNREYYPLLNKIYGILTELKNQGKHITLAKGV